MAAQPTEDSLTEQEIVEIDRVVCEDLALEDEAIQ